MAKTVLSLLAILALGLILVIGKEGAKLKLTEPNGPTAADAPETGRAQPPIDSPEAAPAATTIITAAPPAPPVITATPAAVPGATPAAVPANSPETAPAAVPALAALTPAAPVPNAVPKAAPVNLPPDAPAAASPRTVGDLARAADPLDVAVLVNKTRALPEGYTPPDLIESGVPFLNQNDTERRLMRTEAAQAAAALFAAAKRDGLPLAGVSAYRSYATQVTLFNYYVQTRGEAAARTFSAEPGHSEHQTGLAIDVSGSTGRCAAEDCFADTNEARWLAAHASEHGFIIRYPKGKEDITGYKYEPWHLRYVGREIAQAITNQAVTLEEYFTVITAGVQSE